MEEFPRKYTFRTGIKAFLDLIVKKNNLSVIHNSEVQSISVKDSLYTISTNGETYQTKKIAFATDPQTTGRLLKDIAADISGVLSDIQLSRSESLNVVVEKDHISLKEIAGIIPMDDAFSSVVARDTVLHPLYRGFTFHFEDGKKTLGEQIKTACEVLNISEKDIVEHSSTKHLLPAPRIKDMNIAERIDTHKDIYVLGNYLYGLSLEDCALRSAEEYKRYKTSLM